MLSDRVLDWTQQWKQEDLQQGLQQGLYSEWRMLLRLIHRRLSEAVADQSALMLERIEQPTMFEDLGEELFNCVDDAAWLARLNAVVGKVPP
ncbi:MAG: transposase [Candidatus Contendobacter sp.]|nr:transposase [Candidatus Contendobacter sp.]